MCVWVFELDMMQGKKHRLEMVTRSSVVRLDQQGIIRRENSPQSDCTTSWSLSYFDVKLHIHAYIHAK